MWVLGPQRLIQNLKVNKWYQGRMSQGIVEIQGGNVEQQINEIHLSIHTQYIKESNDHKHHVTATIERIRLSSQFTISANERKVIPFSFQLPLDTPVTIGRTKVWVKTDLDIKNAIDSKDKDFLHVSPNSLLNGVLNSISSLGFRLREAECEKATYRLHGRLPFIQEFEFVPTSGTFRGRLDELELVFIPSSPTTADVHLQIDRKARGLSGFLSEAMEMDETNISASISTSDLPTLPQKLKTLLERYS